MIIAMNAVSQTAPNFAVFSRAAGAASALFDMIDRVSNINSLDVRGETPDSISGAISLENITFAYPTRPQVTVLKDFSLHIPAGKTTALVVCLAPIDTLWNIRRLTCNVPGNQRLR